AALAGVDLASLSSAARPWRVSPLTTLLDSFFPSAPPTVRLLEARVAPLPERTAASAGDLPVAPPRIEIRIAFDVSWGSDCADAHGSLSASANGAPTVLATPPSLFRDLCG